MGLGIYIHIPFCLAKCAYCDFVSFAGRRDLFVPYVHAVRQEIWSSPTPAPSADEEPRSAETLYIGGGTPSILPPELLAPLIQAVERHFPLSEDAEITVEVNPGTVEAARLRALRALGVGRLSIGVQSFLDQELRLLGRVHTSEEAAASIALARDAGFENINIDLIFGLPRQTPAEWDVSLDRALAFRPAHISLYALSVEEGTPLAGRIAAGELPPPDDDIAAEMYERAEDRIAEAGYRHYEISNWALPGYESRHNLGTWRNQPYLGFGAAAHSHLGRRRWWNTPDPEEYIRRVEAGASPVQGSEELDDAAAMGETMILGLRLLEEGVTIEPFRRRFGLTPWEAFPRELRELERQELVEGLPDRIRLTRRGRLLGNQVFMRFVSG